MLLILLPFKAAVVTLLARWFSGDRGASIRSGLGLAQAGEFGFVLLTLAGGANLLSAEAMQNVLALRVHRAPAAAGTYRLSDLDVASRLSFFLWSSIPDDRLLTLADAGSLRNPPTLEKEVRRMLADPRATDALVNDFAAQWLNLRRVEEVVVDPDPLSQLRRESAAGVQAGNGDVRRQHVA